MRHQDPPLRRPRRPGNSPYVTLRKLRTYQAMFILGHCGHPKTQRALSHSLMAETSLSRDACTPLAFSSPTNTHIFTHVGSIYPLLCYMNREHVPTSDRGTPGLDAGWPKLAGTRCYRVNIAPPHKRYCSPKNSPAGKPLPLTRLLLRQGSLSVRTSTNHRPSAPNFA